MKLNRLTVTVVGLVAFGLVTTSVLASKKDKGRKIVEDAEDFHAGYVDSLSKGTMILRDAGGGEATRKMTLKLREDREDGDDTIMLFHTPKDIKGTAMLTDSHKDSDNDQWVYLPALKRTKRITTSNKHSAFLGSEFTYDDLVPRNIDKYKYKFVKEDKCGKEKCYVISVTPKDKKSIYKRQVVHITKNNYLTVKVDYYNRKKKLAKTMVAEGFKKYQGKHWASSTVTMTNHQTKKSTVFKYKDYKFKTGLKARDFDKNALNRMR